jgi:hypothetical protein
VLIPYTTAASKTLFHIRPSGCDAVDFFAFYFRKTGEGAVDGRFHLFYQLRSAIPSAIPRIPHKAF